MTGPRETEFLLILVKTLLGPGSHPRLKQSCADFFSADAVGLIQKFDTVEALRPVADNARELEVSEWPSQVEFDCYPATEAQIYRK
jgi:hypothetical protein